MDEGHARRAALFPLIWKVSGQLVVYSPALMFSTRRDEEAHLMLPCWDMLWRSSVTWWWGRNPAGPTHQHQGYAQDGRAIKWSNPGQHSSFEAFVLWDIRDCSSETQGHKKTASAAGGTRLCFPCSVHELWKFVFCPQPPQNDSQHTWAEDQGIAFWSNPLILTTNTGDLQQARSSLLEVIQRHSKTHTFRSGGAACIFSNINQCTGQSHTFKSRPTNYGKV